MNTKTVYLYDADGLFTQPYEAQESPLEKGVYLEPEQSTAKAPPSTGVNQVAKRNAGNTDWVVVPDFRGQIGYDQTTGASVEVTELGDLPANITLMPPPPTAVQMQTALEAKVQELLDSQARSMNFDNILSGISNASLPIGEYRQTDGAALLLWRARVWEKAAEIRDAFLAGQRAMPTWDEVEVALPSYPVVA